MGGAPHPYQPRPSSPLQENLDGETVARLAAVHGTRPNPAGPASTLKNRYLRSGSFSGGLGLGTSFRRLSIGGVADEDGQTGGGGDGGVGAVKDALADWWHSDPQRRPAAARAAERLEEAAARASAERAASPAPGRHRERSMSLSMPTSASFLPRRGSSTSIEADSPTLAPRHDLRETDGKGEKGGQTLSGGGTGTGPGWDGWRSRSSLTWLCWCSGKPESE